MKETSAQRWAEFALLLAGALYGAQTPVGRELGNWFTPMTIVALRFTMAAPFCLIGLRRTPRSMQSSPIRLLTVALLFPIGATLFTYAYFHATIAVAIFGYYIANLLSSLIVGVVANKERIDMPTIVAFVASLLAVALIGAGQSSGNDDGGWLGLFLAACSGLAATAIASEQKILSRTIDGDTITLAQVAGGMIFVWPVVLIARDTSITHATASNLLLALLYGLLFFGCNRLMVYGFNHGPIGIGSILLSFEVVVGPVLAFVFFSEGMTGPQLLGGVCTAFAVIAAAKRAPVTPEDK